MQVKIDKEKFHNILMKLFNSMIGRIKTSEDKDGKYIELFDKNGDNFADIWLKGSAYVKGKGTYKRCKKLISFHIEAIEQLEKFVPVLRKKQYAKTLIDYIEYHTGIKGDCVEFEYNWEYHPDDDGDLTVTSKTYKYRNRNKK